MRRVLFAFLMAGVLCAADRIGQRMQAFIDKGKAAGIVTLVEVGGKVVHHEAVGVLDLETKAPAQRDSIFEVMSMTKPVTGTAILMLAEEGRLALTDPVEKHLPEFRGQGKPWRAITIRDLLTHTSGLPEMPPAGMGGANFYGNMNRTLGEAVLFYSQMPLLFEPGTKVQYSNPGMATLGRIIEVVSGQAYEKFLEERIFRPLGMKDSFFFPAEAQRARIARVYVEKDGKLADSGYGVMRKGAKYPMPEGGLYSTAADLAAFYLAYLHGGKPLISKAAHATMTAIHNAEVQRGGNAFGLAWNVTQNAAGALGLRSIGSYGHGGAFGTLGWIDPKKDMVAVLLIQLVGGAVGDVQNAFTEMAGAIAE